VIISMKALRLRAFMSALLRLSVVSVLGLSTALAAVEPRLATWWDDREAAISFTMDDGFRGHLAHVAPLLEEQGWRRTFFIVAGWVKDELPAKPKPTHSTWAEWQALAARGHEIGNHSMSHASLDKPDAPEL
jgi:peptidoglycan/xylan/chitin deacetylase (PgdA/CDA1 family)